MADEPAESLSISFTGFTEVRLTRNNTDMVATTSVHKVSRGYLFRRCVVLDRARTFYGPGTLAWPFAFRIPCHAAGNRTGEDLEEDGFFDCQSPWKGSVDVETHVLPPSLRYSPSFKCLVLYTLHARLIRPSYAILQRRQNLAASTEITVSPRTVSSQWDVDTAQNLTRVFYCNTSVSHRTRIDAIKLRARQLNRMVGQTECYYACCQDGNLHLKIKIPSIISTESRSPLPFSAFVASSGCHHIAQIKKIDIKKFTLDLVVITRVRAGAHHEKQRSVHNLCNESFTIPLAYTSERNPETAEDEDYYTNLSNVGKVAREALRSGRWVPGFATYNIFRAYSLRFDISLSFAGKTVSFRQENIPVEIVNGQPQSLEEWENSCTLSGASMSQVTTIDSLSTDLDHGLYFLTEYPGNDNPPPVYRA